MFYSTHASVQLEVLSYENPAAGQTPDDGNVLVTCLRLIDRGRRWDTIAPILYTWDIQKLIYWFSDMLADREVPDGLMFAEPCLAIELSRVSANRERYWFRILLRFEATPPWYQESPDTPYVIPIDCSRNSISEAVSGLTAQLLAFPVR
ncbi:WapI family immunity protein [Spirosoma utsteinense]|uniref:Transposase n=1 Tax=Spirosoma utsteinense TaxID=2585773 RepID=A0ABR6WDT6_9BACT|nr:hypothetical protein [Spirosoma utsteinense]MBC3788767.1 hypothetical protein [Spirosoma utsteinense]MBC3794720.1 hypothetical protein [Spirosoma utsteinense]